MTRDETYNGWTNYATWRVNLEILDDYWASLDDDEREQWRDDPNGLADHFTEVVDDAITDYGQREGLAVDYARAFVNDVNFYEIALTNLTDLPEEPEEDEDDEDEDAPDTD